MINFFFNQRRDYAKRQEKFLVPTSGEWTPEF